MTRMFGFVCLFHKTLKNNSVLLKKVGVPVCVNLKNSAKYLSFCNKRNEVDKKIWQPRVEEHSNRLDVKLPRWPKTLHLSYIWLRDHCRCSECYHQKTFQRIKDIYEIPLNIRPLSVESSDEYLKIIWPDGHESCYDFKFLWQNIYEGQQTTAIKSNAKILWTKSTFPSLDEVTVPMHSLRHSIEGKRCLVESILKYGFGFVSEVPSTLDDTRITVEQICPVKRTCYGEMWAFQADMNLADTAYSDEFLGAHTDTTYYSEAVRIQVFHSLQAALEGGETLLVDGFNVASQFRKDHPTGYNYLSTTAFPCEYIDNGENRKSVDVIFKHHPVSKELIQLRYNLYDRAPLSTVPFPQLQEYYLHIQNLTAVVRRSKNEMWLKLEPGLVIFIDNWRILHGRNKYVGPRIMGGCYLDNSDFLSMARVLGITDAQ